MPITKAAGRGLVLCFVVGSSQTWKARKLCTLRHGRKARGLAFLRFDYSGHGESSGAFEDGCIGDWHEDTLAILEAVTEGPLCVVGSSMGGWQALLLARAIPRRIKGLVTIAAAPDFTEDGYWANFTDAQKAELEAVGHVALPSDYMEPYIITKRMIEDGRTHLVLRDRLELPFPVRFLQGTADTAVSVATAVRLLEHSEGPDIRLNLVKDADHRFSDAVCLTLIEEAVADVIAAA